MIGKLHDCCNQTKLRLQYPGHRIEQFSHIARTRNTLETSLQPLLQSGIFLGLADQGGKLVLFDAELITEHADLALQQRHGPTPCGMRDDQFTQQSQMALKKIRTGAQKICHLIFTQTGSHISISVF